jgi:hypothetical protein
LDRSATKQVEEDFSWVNTHAGETPYFLVVALTPRRWDITDSTMIRFLSTTHLHRSGE